MRRWTAATIAIATVNDAFIVGLHHGAFEQLARDLRRNELARGNARVDFIGQGGIALEALRPQQVTGRQVHPQLLLFSFAQAFRQQLALRSLACASNKK